MTIPSTTSRVCVCGCGQALPAGRRLYASNRCSDTERKRRYRARKAASSTDAPHAAAATLAALALAAAHQQRAAAAVQIEREMSAAVDTAVGLRARVVTLEAELSATRADARALALIVRRVFQMRDWRGYERSLQVIVDRQLIDRAPLTDRGE
ncbi:hypothetical protein [Cellulomonas sp. ES6]|uniref:hypothetical protein n=1 Tax=Cellulomonas sp. ES6 TaxID=3039384 RepID=UPI0024B7CCB9|nr:hypothetical protein [Cellulomonas sp. ES6]WHP16587.1 hypothetical protein P9841_13310 [Cellulomonas sp. ES6]